MAGVTPSIAGASPEDPMRQDRTKWNKKYRKDKYPAGASDVVKKFCHLAPGKKALDIAAGNGRNSIFIARQGFTVDAVDISEVGLTELAGRYSNINAICADLDQFDIHADHYDLIVNIKFLNRRLFACIREGLKPGGVVIFETLLDPGNMKNPPKHHRDYLLKPNELLHAFQSMRIIHYCETDDAESDESHPLASLVGIKQ